jgi:hypothetical protein
LFPSANAMIPLFYGRLLRFWRQAVRLAAGLGSHAERLTASYQRYAF